VMCPRSSSSGRNTSALVTVTVTVSNFVTLFANNFLWSCCRRHFVQQLNRPSTQFSESRKDICRCPTTKICHYILAVDHCLAICKLLSFGLVSLFSRLSVVICTVLCVLFFSFYMYRPSFYGLWLPDINKD